jgi:hypothetical protein
MSAASPGTSEDGQRERETSEVCITAGLTGGKNMPMTFERAMENGSDLGNCECMSELTTLRYVYLIFNSLTINVMLILVG